ncbi:uncharacterized protein F5147DRAFT_747869 [Suillus discolor]|uniref:CxC2-like cysteine cluster KDZ transposase-associated domain-containing protein n=1 Tax=Suillus discolor TaxID=1912936 RepID=A0A9P7EX26_9AGAM|nr:uncharacterized protein F5147DRAFT_747869 [Suillus discolor]KAG2093898.1 hypothetical protein F5147DRAFT_747869 [Suillus discolor]
MIQLEGRGNKAACSLCRCGGEDLPIYRCRDCFGIEMVCQSCVVECYRCNPLHRIEEWMQDFFKCVSLKSLGLRIQLGHNPGEVCLNKQRANGDNFTVVDAHEIHEIGLDFCGCETAQIHHIQLLCARWFSATSSKPQTAATFAVMEFFHLLSFESKVSPYEFYHSLSRRTDNTRITPIKDRYSAFLRMVREWRNLKLLKRSGRGHHPNGIGTTQEGDCVVLCPACPQPGINLPEGWEKAEPRWVYALFLSIDANFRLKRKAVSSDKRDPSLNNGSSYFVEEKHYKSYLAERVTLPQERSACISHNAVNMADTKSSRGLAATGVGTIDCARHEMKLASGVGDLQKGEKYINMDYLVFSVIVGSGAAVLNLSYDIACQWHKKLWARLASMPDRLQFDRKNKTVRFFVPKFHINAHIPACQTNFLFNYSKGVGCTDGEAPERGWVNVNRVATSTKEMGPGARRDTLDNNFGDWNWKKVTTFSHVLLHKLKESVRSAKIHGDELAELQSTIDDVSLNAWKSEVEAWEDDSSQPNPFESRIAPMTQMTVRLQLAENEAHDLQAGINVSLHDEVSLFILISTGLDLEDQQRRLCADATTLGVHATEIQKAKICTRSNALLRKIELWTTIQTLYMPTVSLLRSASELTREASNNADRPENLLLWLPSSLGTEYSCDRKLQELEWDLCFAQAHDALNKLKYDMAHAALIVLGPILGKVAWEGKLRVLHVADLRTLGDIGPGQSEGTRDISWIWKVLGALDNDNAGLQDCLWIEWCKARAREGRWSKEVLLLLEEMRRVIEFFKWQAKWWKDRGTAAIFVKPAHQEGGLAYAARQAHIRLTMVKHVQELWVAVPSIVQSQLLPDDEDDTAETADVLLTIEGPPADDKEGSPADDKEGTDI